MIMCHGLKSHSHFHSSLNFASGYVATSSFFSLSLQRETSDKEARHRDKMEAHLYCSLKVATDADIKDQVGVGLLACGQGGRVALNDLTLQV